MRAIIVAAIAGLTFQAVLASPPATVVVGGKSLLGVPYNGPDGPPDEDLQRDWEDLLSQGGCTVPTQNYRTELDQKYGARKALIHERLAERYGDERAKRDVIIAGACHRPWVRAYSQVRLETDIEYWEACLGIRPSDRVGICPR